MNTDAPQTLLERLSHSQIYQDYERAFREATGLPLRLSPAGGWQQADRHGNPLCALLARQNKACAACRHTHHELTSGPQDAPRTVKCFAGLNETAIPLRASGQVIGFLRTGEVLDHQPDEASFLQVVARMKELGVKVQEEKFREAYFQSQVFSEERYEAVLQLLKIFAQHLSLVAHQIVVQTAHAECPNITKARAFIDANYAEDLSLAAVARAARMSTFYFCKQFKKATGLSFTEYLGRVRVEKAKEQLLKPHARVSEIAYEVGFQSLTHFNRVFKKLSGKSPTIYRANLPFAHFAN